MQTDVNALKNTVAELQQLAFPDQTLGNTSIAELCTAVDRLESQVAVERRERCMTAEAVQNRAVKDIGELRKLVGETQEDWKGVCSTLSKGRRMN